MNPFSRSRLLLSAVFIFCFVFNIELTWPDGLSLSMVALAVGMLSLLVSSRFVLLQERSFLLSLGLVLPALCISIVHTAVRNSDASTLAALYLKTQIFVYAAISVYWGLFLRVPGTTLTQGTYFILASVAWAFAAQAVFVVLSFAAPEFRDLVDALLVAKGNLSGLEGSRFKGLTNSGGANLSMAMSFGAAMSMYLAINNRRLQYAVIAVLILAASLLVGRSGIVGFGMISAAFLTRIRLKGHLPRLRAIAALLTLGVAFAFGASFIDTTTSDEFQYWWSWFSGEAAASLDELLTMYSHEYSIADLLIGKGFFEAELYGSMRTDSGYLKTVFSVGVPAAALFYSGLLVMYVAGAHGLIAAAPDKRLATAFATLMVLLIFVYESKEAMAYQNFTGRLMLFSFLLFAAALRRSQLKAVRDTHPI